MSLGYNSRLTCFAAVEKLSVAGLKRLSVKAIIRKYEVRADSV